MEELNMSGFEIDPVEYGQLIQKVDQLSHQVDKLESGMEELLALANKGRGGFWVGMVVVSAMFTLLGYFSQNWMHK